jgi:hypothetical protein
MAQTGYTPIQLYRTATASAAPTSGNLADGELAINTLDGKLFYKDSSGNVQTIANKGTGTIGGLTTQVQFNSSGALGGSASLTWDGTTLTSANSITSPVHKSATTLSLQTNGTTTALYIDASQNVGIGTSSPSTQFEVSNTSTTATITSTATSGYSVLGLRNTGTSGRSWQVAVGGSATGVAGSYYIYDVTAASERMRIDSSGNVGIGTTSPGAKLQISGSTVSSNFAFGTTTAAAGQIASDTGYAGARIVFYGSTSGGSGTLDIYAGGTAPIQFNTNGSERMRIDSSGNVGIGTTSPSTQFEVSNTSTTATITSTATSGYSVLGLRNTGTSGRSWQVAVGGSATAVAGSYYVYDATAAAVRMLIDSSGNVGIGTSSPSASAILDAQSTTKGVRFPNMTTTQKNAISSPAAGLVVFDTTLAKLCVYSGSAWQTITSV